MTRKVLIADDDPAICDAIELILDDAGYDVITAMDGRVVQKVRDHLPDVILLDIWMSGVDGRDICVFLKTQESTKHIPIIMVSANTDTEHIANAAGADGFVLKPFEMHHLLTTIEKHLSPGSR